MNINNIADSKISINNNSQAQTKPSLSVTEGQGADKRNLEISIIETSNLSIVSRGIQTEEGERFEKFLEIFYKKFASNISCQTIRKAQDEAFRKYFGISVEQYKSLRAEGWNGINQAAIIEIFVNNLKNLGQVIQTLIRYSNNSDESKFLFDFFNDLEEFLVSGKDFINEEDLKIFQGALAFEEGFQKISEQQLVLHFLHSKIFPESIMLHMDPHWSLDFFNDKETGKFSYEIASGFVKRYLENKCPVEERALVKKTELKYSHGALTGFLEPEYPRSDLNEDQMKLKAVSEINYTSPILSEQIRHFVIVAAVEEMLTINDSKLRDDEKLHLNMLKAHVYSVMKVYMASYSQLKNINAFSFGLKLQRVICPEDYKKTLKEIRQSHPTVPSTVEIRDKYDTLILIDFIKAGIYTFSEIEEIKIDYGVQCMEKLKHIHDGWLYVEDTYEKRKISDSSSTKLLFDFLSANKDRFTNLKSLEISRTHFGDVKIHCIPSLEKITVQQIIGNLIIPTLPKLTRLEICRVQFHILVDVQPNMQLVNLWGFHPNGATFILPETQKRQLTFHGFVDKMKNEVFELNEEKFSVFSTYSAERVNKELLIDLIQKAREADVIDSSLAIDTVTSAEGLNDEISIKSTSRKQGNGKKDALTINEVVKTETDIEEEKIEVVGQNAIVISNSPMNFQTVFIVGALGMILLYMIKMMMSSKDQNSR